MGLQAKGGGLPAWLPESARVYLEHTEGGRSIRAIARDGGRHASTVLRLVRRLENRRDDPLFDSALTELGRLVGSEAGADIAPPGTSTVTEGQDVTATIRGPNIIDGAVLEREARRVLRRLCEPGALLAVSAELDKAVVMKDDLRVAIVARQVAEAFAVKDWIGLQKAGRIATYAITSTGRLALKRLLAAGPHDGPQEMPGFGDQHRDFESRTLTEDGVSRRVRYNLAESPLSALARRRDKDGEPFLSADLVAAGERLREDFEVAQLGPKVAQNWDRFLTGGDRPVGGGDTRTGGSEAARDRVAAALRDLGPGLGDMVLRCCCFLEGLEQAERRMGWSARSGKIVLRIALLRLKRHYEGVNGGKRPLVG
jgi:Domain of unknown function (DUF6456)